jgi:rhodanese-related sulfurtransferase|tara:strand:+ start:693 stop:1106 length:414 start_codon:yes stop_codon:yes gene_type:complete
VEIFVFVSEQWLLITLLAALIGVFLITEQRKSGKSLGSSELVRLMNNDEAVVVDVRSAAEYETGHIHGALSIPHLKLASRITELEKYRDKIIVVVDKIGQHSGAAGKALSSQEFNVRRLGGGISEWQGSSLPLVKGK